MDRRIFIMGLIAALIGGVLKAKVAAPATVSAVDDTVLTEIMAIGGWSTTATDTTGGEQLNRHADGSRALDLVKTLTPARIGGPYTPAEITNLGVLVLLLAVAEWGVAGATAPDPAKKHWTGPDLTQGKHLMSYTIGGIGVAHYDVGDALAFFDQLGISELGARTLAAKLRSIRFGEQHGATYDSVRARGGLCSHPPIYDPAWPKSVRLNVDCARYSAPATASLEDLELWTDFQKWTAFGLRQRETQRWIIDRWIQRIWMPSFQKVMANPLGTLPEAFVLARIVSSSPVEGVQAYAEAQRETGPTNRVLAALRSYAKGHSHRSRRGFCVNTHADRAGVMQRPTAILGLPTCPTTAAGGLAYDCSAKA